MSEKIVVVGGVAGGATAVARLRRLDEDAQIVLFERGHYVSFANCGLPYYVGGTIARRDALFVSDEASIEGKYGVDIRCDSEVTAIDRKAKTVHVRQADGHEYDEPYDRLLLSTGSHPFVPPIPGTDAPNVFTLWNIPDADRVYRYVQERQPRRAVIAGGGFVGLELAENLVDRGIRVTIVELADQVMAPLDPDMAKLVANHLVDKGVTLKLSCGVEAIGEGGASVRLSDGTTLPTDMVMLSVGVRPNSDIAREAGLEVNQRGGLVVDQDMRTSDPDIFAVGDMVQVTDGVSGQPTMVPLAGPANRQGRAVAANMLGKREEAYEGTIGTSVAKVFDLAVASTGQNEKALRRAGKELWRDYGVALVHPANHVGYYPGSSPLTLKLTFSIPDGRVLGAQVVGRAGVDKRVDTVATTIHFGGTVYDLTKLELAYAPPFSSAKDPVNMAGYVATDILEGLTSPITVGELEAGRDRYRLVDVREQVETVAGMMAGATNIPLTQLRDRLGELDPEVEYVVYCAVGLRGYVAERILRQRGFRVRNLAGGYLTYKDLEQPLDRLSAPAPTIQIHQERLSPAGGGEATGSEADAGDGQALTLDVCGMSCPGPIVSVSGRMDDLAEGQTLRVRATDPGFGRDIVAWATNTGNTVVSREDRDGVTEVVLRKGTEGPAAPVACTSPNTREKTMIVFDGDLDKAIASFIIATGAAAMGNKVNMFFTFWGLNILRRPEKVPVKKDLVGRVFAGMMPRGSRRLGLSKMNFLGAGSKMIRSVMDRKGITSLEDLIAQAQAAGVKMTACQMSMDVMGITREELIDGVEVGGVASMLNDSDNSNMNLFI